MTNRLVGLFVMPIKWEARDRHQVRAETLRNGIRDFRAALTEIRRRPCFRHVAGGVEVFEFDLSEHGRSWNVHCHVVLDVVTVDPADVEAVWKQLTGGRGWFSLPPVIEDGHVEPENIDRFAAYMTSCASWSPAPGALEIAQLDVLQRAIRGRQLATGWGTAQAPKKRSARAATATNRGPQRVSVALHPDQVELVEAAIERASELSRSKHRGHNLALACMDFLATNEFRPADDDQPLRFLLKLGRLLGFELSPMDRDGSSE